MKKLNLKLAFQIIGLIIFVPLAVLAINTVNEGFRINNGDTNVTIDAWGTCQKVTNTSGKHYFVPTKTSAEWSAFRSHLPSGVTLGACSTNPSGLSLTGGNGGNFFQISWTAGAGNGGANGCKLQYVNGGSWYDITSANNLNCDSNLNSANFTLNGDGWKSNWGGTQIRILRKSDSVAVGTFAQTLTCTSQGWSLSPTPYTDEDCNGYWDNYTWQQAGGCPSGQFCYNAWIYSDANCDYDGYLEGTQCVDDSMQSYMNYCDVGCAGTSCYRIYDSGCTYTYQVYY